MALPLCVHLCDEQKSMISTQIPCMWRTGSFRPTLAPRSCSRNMYTAACHGGAGDGQLLLCQELKSTEITAIYCPGSSLAVASLLEQTLEFQSSYIRQILQVQLFLGGETDSLCFLLHLARILSPLVMILTWWCSYTIIPSICIHPHSTVKKSFTLFSFYSFVLVGPRGFLLYPMVIIHFLIILCPKLSSLMLSFDTSPSFFGYFITFWHRNMIQGHPVLSLIEPRQQSFH